MKALLILLTVFLFVASAQAQYGGGTGEPNDPYKITTFEDLMLLGERPVDYDKHFKLMVDIDLNVLAGTRFNIIGDSDGSFTGVFNGNGHTISRFSYTSTGRNAIGPFGIVGGRNAVIKNLGLIQPNIAAGTGSCVGSLVG